MKWTFAILGGRGAGGLRARSLGRLTLIAILALVLLVAATIVLQSTGMVPLQTAG